MVPLVLAGCAAGAAGAMVAGTPVAGTPGRGTAAAGTTGASGQAVVNRHAEHAEAAAALRRGYWTFVSQPRLHPPNIRIKANHGVDRRSDIFVAPKRSYALHLGMRGQSGPEILDGTGNPIWEHPLPRGRAATNFQVQSVDGVPVLSWWQGVLTSHGIGHNGEGVIFNRGYQQAVSLRAANGYHIDVHEFYITDHNTAYLVAWKIAHRNLTRFGGRARGQVIDYVVQEVDIATNKLIWQWDPINHGLLGESHTPAPKSGTWNPFHLNSVDLTSDGNLLISSRNTWAIYLVNRHTGDIIWRLGGRHSTFAMAPNARFAWQHDARFLPNHKVSLFDDEAAPKEANQSRGLILALDMRTKRARVAAQYTHRPPLLAGSQGNTQVLPDGHAFVGWGQMPYLSEFGHGDRLLFDARFHDPDETYRAFRFRWTGSPTYPPSIAVRPAGRQRSAVYASWNGATRVARWQLLAGAAQGTATTPVGSPVPRTGFETVIDASSTGPWFAVRALDAYGNALGTSKAVQRQARGVSR